MIQFEATAQIALRRKPKNDLEDINKIGRRNISGILNEFSMQDDRNMGYAHSRRFYRAVNHRLVNDPLVSEYVNRLGQNIGRNSDAQFPLEFRVIHNSAFNAAAYPGGFMHINTGLIMFAESEAELAGVIGHEIAHVAGRHGTRQLSQKNFWNTLIGGALGALVTATGDPHHWGVEVAYLASGVAVPMAFFKFKRSFEEKSDILGVQYMYKTGYDPLAAMRLWQRSHEQHGSFHSLQATHPPSEKRAHLIHTYVSEVLPPKNYRTDNSEFYRVQDRIAELYNLPHRPRSNKNNNANSDRKAVSHEVATPAAPAQEALDVTAPEPRVLDAAAPEPAPVIMSEDVVNIKPVDEALVNTEQGLNANDDIVSNLQLPAQDKWGPQPGQLGWLWAYDDKTGYFWYYEIQSQTYWHERWGDAKYRQKWIPPQDHNDFLAPSTPVPTSASTQDDRQTTVSVAPVQKSKNQNKKLELRPPHKPAWEQDYETGLLLYYEASTKIYWWHHPIRNEYWYARSKTDKKTKWHPSMTSIVP